MVVEETTSGKPLFRKWQPHPIYNGHRTVQGDAPMRDSEPEADLPSGLPGPIGWPQPTFPPPVAAAGATGPAGP
jgi:hypothetical protein